jgi:hypothetical protein
VYDAALDDAGTAAGAVTFAAFAVVLTHEQLEHQQPANRLGCVGDD